MITHTQKHVSKIYIIIKNVSNNKQVTLLDKYTSTADINFITIIY